MKRGFGGALVRAWRAAAVLILAVAGPSGAADDFTFLLISDTHVGAQNPKANPPVTPEDTERQVRASLARLLPLARTPYPERGPFGEASLRVVPGDVKGLLIAGDLTDNAPERPLFEAQWATFEKIFPAAGVELEGARVPVLAAIGNHDGDPDGPVRTGMAVRNRAQFAQGAFAALSDNAVHYAVKWGDLHVICVNLYPADAPDAATPFRFGNGGRVGGWNDPQGALTFLTNYLGRAVGRSGDPVIVLQHYGFDGFSLNDWNWWTPAQRRAYYEALKGYNVLAILHGHDHAAERYRWPDAQANPQEVRALFGDAAPADMRSFDVISTGRLGWVFRVRDGKLLGMHHDGSDWSRNPSLAFVKPLRPARP